MFFITQAVKASVFKITSSPSRSGACFVMNCGLGFVFVTARHVAKALSVEDTIFFTKANGEQVAKQVASVAECPRGYDLVAFTTEQFLLAPFGADNTPVIAAGNVADGIDLKILGFPHSMYSEHQRGSSWADPLIRSGTLAGYQVRDGLKHCVIDGIVSGGNSGGPAICQDFLGKYDSNVGMTYVLAGLMTQFLPEKPDKTPIIDRRTNLPSSDFYSHSHSGMSLAVPGAEVNKFVQHAYAKGDLRPMEFTTY